MPWPTRPMKDGLPASNRPEDVREYVRNALDQNSALTSLIDAEVGNSFLVYEVTIVDRDGTALISSDASLPGRKVLPRPPLSQLVSAGFIQQLRLIYGAPQAYDVSDPFKLGPPGRQVPFGEIRVALHTGLLAIEITPALRSAILLALISVLASVLLAAVVSSGHTRACGTHLRATGPHLTRRIRPKAARAWR